MAIVTTNEIIDWLEQVKDSIRDVQAKYQGRHANWETPGDARGAFFTGTKIALLMVQSDLEHLAERVSKEDYWKRLAPNTFRAQDVPVITKEYEISRRWLLMHLVYMQLEEALRRICESVDASFMTHKQHLEAVTDHLLKILSLQENGNLFKLARTIRNSIHNNGRYWPDPDKTGIRKNTMIKWKGREFLFKVGEPIPAGSWEFLAGHIPDLVEAVGEIVLHPKVESLARVARIPT